MNRKRMCRFGLVAAWVMVAAMPAYAQRAGENAVTAAQDAFGTQVGNESIGLYSAGDVRGFSPTEAGNLRLEGLYFDRQGDTTNRIVRGTTVRVGITAQSYPFPAPTGIADTNLRIPGDRAVVSSIATYGPYAAGTLEVDSQFPLVAEKLSMGAGAMVQHEKGPSRNPSFVWNVGGIFRWRPNDSFELIPFGAANFRHDRESGHTVLTAAGNILPPRIDRKVYYGQDWAQLSSQQSAWGFVARADLPGDWTLRAGFFRSLNYRIEQGENFFRNTQADGRTDRSVIIIPGNSLGSYSGEARATRIFVEGQRRHTVHLNVRGRYKKRTFGGTTTIPLGPGIIGVADFEPLPAYTLGPQSRNKVHQGTAGIGYEGLWANVGELTLGLQKTYYHRTTDQPALALITQKDKPWLVNAAAAIYVSRDLAVFGSYTRGLEESGEAPQNAINRGESVPATRTSQVDFGVRYAFTPRLRAVAAVFEVEKPFFNLDAGNIFAQLGNVRHRGIEASLTGQPIEGLTMVAGTVLLQARVTGSAVALGRTGRVPLGRYPHIVRLNLQYGPKAWRGLALDGQVENQSDRYADVLNTFRVPGNTILSLGGRYTFRVNDVNAMVRAQVQNVTNEFNWVPSATGQYFVLEQRRFQISLTTDF